MKKTLIRPLAAILAAILLTSVFVGCNRNTEDPTSAAETPEFVFIPEFISLPEGITDISYLVYNNGKLFFSSWYMSEEEPYSYGVKLFTMDIDGTNLAELPNYSPEKPPDGAMGHSQINALRTDGDGNLWVVESGNFYDYDLPEDYDEESDEIWQYYRELGTIMAVRKLDDTGAELMSIDISSLAANTDWFWIRTFSVDDEGNLYIATDQTIHVMDSSGRKQFQLEVPNWIEQLVRMPDGFVAFFGYAETGRVMRKIDYASRTWGEDLELPMNAYNIFPGGEDYGIIFNDGSNLFGIEADTGESVKLLNWIDSDISPDNLNNITMLSDGRILLTNQGWNRSTGMSTFELIILTKAPYDSLPPRTILSFATVYMDWSIRSAIVNFNRTNGTYRIQVRDYSEFNTEDDWNAGFTRLSTEMISGRIPDILDISGLPLKQYVARGLLADLYTFIDADPVLNRSNLMESIFRATEIGGGLYQIFPTFNISTLVGNPSVLGPGIGWNMNEFRDVLKANPQADVPIGYWMTKWNFLQLAVSMSMDEFVDWAGGVCYFDRGDFALLLEYANTFPEEFNWDREEWIDESELIATGRQIMMQMGVGDFRSLQMYRALFGGDIVFKGFPAESRNGNTLQFYSGLAMTSNSSNKEGAWEFMRTVLSEDWQRNNTWGFPTNKVVFNEKLEEVMTPEFYIDEDGNEIEISNQSWGWGSMVIEIFAMKQEEADQIMALIDSVSGTASHDERLMLIINEGATEFFAGRRSAQDAARIIQSRASIFISEQS